MMPLERSLEVVRRRLNESGLVEPSITRQGRDSIPGADARCGRSITNSPATGYNRAAELPLGVRCQEPRLTRDFARIKS